MEKTEKKEERSGESKEKKPPSPLFCRLQFIAGNYFQQAPPIKVSSALDANGRNNNAPPMH